MSFYYLNQNTNNGSSLFENFGFDKNFNLENFESMPPIDTKNTDSNYQCSDNVQITGNTIGSSFPNSTLAECKSQCKSDNTCVGFDFDNSSSSCTLRNSITDLTSTKQNNVMCVKKTSSACKLPSYVNPEVEAQNIINEQEQSQTSSGSMIPGVPAPEIGGNTNPTPAQPQTKPMPTPVPPEKIIKNSCKPDTIYVDLPCFLNKMNVLQNHSDNLMIDLQLLITNLKGCSYIRKPTRRQKVTNPFQPINGGSSDDDWSLSGNFNIGGSSSLESSPISSPNVPSVPVVQDTIKVHNTSASVLYANNPATNTNVMLGITETFDGSESTSSFLNSFTFKVLVLVILLVLLMNMK
jgi:hypothetical protein